MRLKIWVVAVVFGVLLSSTATARAQTYAYDVIDLGLIGPWTESYGNGLSNNGFAAGDFRDPLFSNPGRGFRWQGGFTTVLPLPPGHFSAGASGVNNSGVAVGTSLFLDIPNQALFQRGYFYNGSTNLVPTLGNGLGDFGQSNNATNINNHGVLTGTSERVSNPNDPQFGRTYAYTYDIGSTTLTQLPTFFANASRTVGNDISDTGFVVGEGQRNASFVFRAFRWQSGNAALTEIPLLESNVNYNSSARGVNDAGFTVGVSDIADPLNPPNGRLSRAFLWDGVNIANLGVLPGRFHSDAHGINNLNQVVGHSFNLSFFQEVDQRAFLLNYSGIPGSPGTLIDLNTQIDPSLGWNLQYAYDINDAGWIIGYGTVFNPLTFQQELHGYILIPNVVPEPTVLALSAFALGGCGIGAWRRWKRRQNLAAAQNFYASES